VRFGVRTHLRNDDFCKAFRTQSCNGSRRHVQDAETLALDFDDTIGAAGEQDALVTRVTERDDLGAGVPLAHQTRGGYELGDST
jgi:hypothetical protein